MSSITYEREGRIATITLNRPQIRNAFTLAMIEELNQCMEQFRSDEQAWVGILTGAGSTFSAGHDVNELNGLKDSLDDLPNLWDTFYQHAFNYNLELYKPVIAAVNGHCVGEGCLAAMSCDLRIAGQSAMFSFPEVAIGIPTIIGAVKAGRMMDLGHAMEFLLMGEARDAEWAYRTGLVNKIVPDDELINEAMVWAKKLTRLGPLAVRCTKEVLMRSQDMAFIDAARLGEGMRRVAFQSQDAWEGIASFLEKRRPVFEGR